MKKIFIEVEVPDSYTCSDLVAIENAFDDGNWQQITAEPNMETAWAEGYQMGIADERTSEDNIGIAGFGAKVNPNRNNPYRNLAPQHRALSDEDMRRLWLSTAMKIPHCEHYLHFARAVEAAIRSQS